MKIRHILGLLSFGIAISAFATQLSVLSSVVDSEFPADIPGNAPEVVPETQQAPVLVAQRYNLTGTWQDDLGSRCFISQRGSNFAWNCYDSANHYSSPPSYRWNNVFMGSVVGNEITGHWQDIPPGNNVLRGTLTLKIVSQNKIRIIGQTGGYGSRVLTR
ncbi:MAG: hypothetical protein F6K10_12865 [Moorea sp. SIO2B7]|nr:hypothetical protein [Moorena sp. SIO2B7]